MGIGLSTEITTTDMMIYNIHACTDYDCNASITRSLLILLFFCGLRIDGHSCRCRRNGAIICSTFPELSSRGAAPPTRAVKAYAGRKLGATIISKHNAQQLDYYQYGQWQARASVMRTTLATTALPVEVLVTCARRI